MPKLKAITLDSALIKKNFCLSRNKIIALGSAANDFDAKIMSKYGLTTSKIVDILETYKKRRNRYLLSCLGIVAIAGIVLCLYSKEKLQNIGEIFLRKIRL